MPGALLTGLVALSLQTQAPPAAVPDTAALLIGSRPIVTFRTSFGPASASERADLARLRITELLRSGSDSVSTLPMGEVTIVNLGHFPAFIIVPGDVDSLRGETMEGKTAQARGRLELAVGEYTEARSARSLIEAGLLSVLVTALLILLSRGIQRGAGWTHRRIDGIEHDTLPRHFPALARIVHPEGIAKVLRGIVTAAAWAVGLSLAYLWATFVLRSFPWTRPAGEALGGVLGSVLSSVGWGLVNWIPDLIAIGVIVTVAVFAGRVIDRLFRLIAAGMITIPLLHAATAEPTRQIAKGLVWLFTIITIYPHLPGSESVAFKGVSVFAGLLVSFGSAGLAGQVMSGLALMYSRGFQVGDFVRIGDYEGTVTAMGMLTTRLRTVKEEYVSIPNAVALGGATMNFSAAAREGHNLLMYTSATIGYDVPRTQVEALMLGAARKSDGVVGEPPPFVLMRALGDYSIEYQLNAALDPNRARELPQLYSALHSRVFDAFAEAGVEILSPSYFALRDGNRHTIPETIRPDLKPGSFRVRVEPAAG